MTSFTSANKRKLVIYEETDNPAYDIYNALDIISEGIALAVSGFTRIHSDTQDELTRLALAGRKKCIDQLNHFDDEIKQTLKRDTREIIELLDESRLRSDEMKLYDLHEDILLVLFQYLPLKDILKLRLLSVGMHHIITTLLLKRVKWNIYLGESRKIDNTACSLIQNYKLSLSHFSPTTPIHLQLTEELATENIVDLQENYQRFCFSSLIGKGCSSVETLERFPEEVCKHLNSIQTLEVKNTKGEEASLIINASSNTIHTLSLEAVTIHPALVQNDFNNLEHLSLRRMKSKDIFNLMEKCPKSLTSLSLMGHLNDFGFENNEFFMKRLESLNISECSEIQVNLPLLLAKCSTTLKTLTLKNRSYRNLANLDVEMCSLEKIEISIGEDLNSLINLANRSPNLQYLEIDDIQCYDDDFIELKNMNIKHLKMQQPDISIRPCVFEHRILRACGSTLECLDLKFSVDLEFLLKSREWFLPNLKVMKVRGFYIKNMENLLTNHIPPDAKVEYLS